MKQLTRREFAAATTSLVALTVFGCKEQSRGGEAPVAATPSDAAGAASAATDTSPSTLVNTKRKDRDKVGTEPFLVGPPSDFTTPGVYDKFAVNGRGAYLVSNGTILIAIDFRCTHLGCAIDFDARINQFVCPCHESHFDPAGQVVGDSKAKRPLKRFALKIIDTDAGPQIQVDPTQPLRQARGEWDLPEAKLSL